MSAAWDNEQKMKFFKYFFSKCDQICRKLRIWSYLLKKSLMENFIFCAVRNQGNSILLRKSCPECFFSKPVQLIWRSWSPITWILNQKWNRCFSASLNSQRSSIKLNVLKQMCLYHNPIYPLHIFVIIEKYDNHEEKWNWKHATDQQITLLKQSKKPGIYVSKKSIFRETKLFHLSYHHAANICFRKVNSR